MPNPYESPATDNSNPSGISTSRTLSRTRTRFLIALHLLSILLVVMMCAGGMVTYAPTITQCEMQNIYLADMFWYGSGVAALQIIGLFLVVRQRRTSSTNS